MPTYADIRKSIVVDSKVVKNWAGGADSYSYTVPTGYYIEIYHIVLTQNGGGVVNFRVDGVDIFAPGGAGTLTASGWKVPSNAASALIFPLNQPLKFGPGSVVAIYQPAPVAGDAVTLFGTIFKNS